MYLSEITLQRRLILASTYNLNEPIQNI
uniref:Uncharacterized protein n=1 Tax=Arundo donax TaxID=35708 RepID=A0A0A9A980_ARUDO